MLPVSLLLVTTVFVVFFQYSEASPAAPGGLYTTRYDNIDVDAILNSKRLLRNYMECIMERGPCTREGVVLKTHLPEALQTECAKCSEKQKQIAGKLMSNLLQYHKDYWMEFLEKYDKDKLFRQKVAFAEGDDDDTEY